jgi:hypothetical protein
MGKEKVEKTPEEKAAAKAAEEEKQAAAKAKKEENKAAAAAAKDAKDGGEEREHTDEEKAEKRKAQLKKVKKEGGKRGVEIEGAGDMGGLQFFSTSVDEPQGDMEFLKISMEAMNEKCDPTEEERKGGSGNIGKMIFSAGMDQLAVVAYVPEAKQGDGADKVSCEEWLKKVLALHGGEVLESSASVCCGRVLTDSNKNVFPLKIRESMILEANNFLRKKGLFPEDDDDDDEMVFGDDDFPS